METLSSSYKSMPHMIAKSRATGKDMNSLRVGDEID